MIQKFWHVGLTVEDLDKSVAQFALLGFKETKRFEKPEPHGLVAIVEHPSGSALELWQWIDVTHPQVKYISNHLAFISDNIEEDVDRLVSQGCEVVIPNTDGVLAHYTYVRDPDGNHIEIAQIK